MNNINNITVKCRVCGDTRHAKIAWAGVSDCYPESSEPVFGGLGPCGDLHSWEDEDPEITRIIREEEEDDRACGRLG
jgi:hypothetical protein